MTADPEAPVTLTFDDALPISAHVTEIRNALRDHQVLVVAGEDVYKRQPLCLTCGTKMRRSGSCYICEGCGSTSGCS